MNGLGTMGEAALRSAAKCCLAGGTAGACAKGLRTHRRLLPRPPLARAGFAWGFCYVQLEVHDTVK